MFQWSRSGASGLRTGLVHTKPARAAATVSRRAGAEPRLVHLAAEGRAKGMLAWRATQALLTDLPHKKARVSAVLDPAEYQLVMTAGVDLPADELRAAMRWRIKDLIGFPVDDAVIDVFRLPPVRGNENMVQVVAAPPTAVGELEAIVHGAARELDVIEIPELALRNLMTLMPQDKTGCAFMLLGRNSIQILVTCQGILFVARRMELPMGSGVEQLALELQRSMQYFESQFDRAPIQEVTIGPANDMARGLAPKLSAATGLKCQVLELNAILACETDIAALDQPEALIAIGAALRPTAGGAAS